MLATNITNHIKNEGLYDLEHLNEKFKVIQMPVHKKINVIDIFDALDSEKDITHGYPKSYGYHEVYDAFMRYTTTNSHVLDTLVEIFTNKINMYNEMIKNESLSYSRHMQIWEDFNNFNQKIYRIVSIYADYLSKNNVKINNYTQSMLNFVSRSIYCKSVINNHLDDISKIVFIENNNVKINLHNIDEFISYIKSLRFALSTNNIIGIDKEKVKKILSDTICDIRIINLLCSYIDDNFKKITKNTDNMNNISSEEKNIQQKIYNIVDILKAHVLPDRIFIAYSKYLRTRIIDTKYNNYEFEMHVINLLKNHLSSDKIISLQEIVRDVIRSNTFASTLQQVDLEISSNKYRKIKFDKNSMRPLLIDNHNWNIPNKAFIGVIYPAEIEICVDFMNKTYASLKPNNRLTISNTLGYIELLVEHRDKKYYLTCTILQATLLTNIINNSKENLSLEKLYRMTNIPLELLLIILNSLMENDLVSEKNEKYKFNRNFTSVKSKINIIESFYKYFSESTEDDINDIDDIDDIDNKSSQHDIDEEDDLPLIQNLNSIAYDEDNDEEDDSPLIQNLNPIVFDEDDEDEEENDLPSIQIANTSDYIDDDF